MIVHLLSFSFLAFVLVCLSFYTPPPILTPTMFSQQISAPTLPLGIVVQTTGCMIYLAIREESDGSVQVPNPSKERCVSTFFSFANSCNTNSDHWAAFGVATPVERHRIEVVGSFGSFVRNVNNIT